MRHSLRLGSRRIGAVAGLATLLLFAMVTRAATFSWVGSSGSWSNSGNWGGGAIPPSAPTTSLSFNRPSGTFVAQQDLANPFVLNSISFGTAAFTISGAPLHLAVDGGAVPQIVVSTPTLQTFDVPLILGDNTVISGAGTVSGQFGTYDQVAFLRPVTSDFALIKSNSNIATFAASNTFGRFDATSGSTIFSGGTTTITSGELGGGLNVRSSVSILSGAVVEVDAPGSSSVIVDGSILRVIGPGSTLRFGATFQLGPTLSSSGNLIVSDRAAVTGAGTFSLGAADRIGAATVLTGATLVTGPARMPYGAVTVSDPGSSWTTPELVVGFPQTNRAGRLTITNGGHVAVASPIELSTGSSSIVVTAASLTTAGLNTSNGARPVVAISDPPGGAALTINGGVSSTFEGAITDSSGGPGSILKTGAGTFTVIGDQSYTGTTRVTAGVLRLMSGRNSSTFEASGGTLEVSGVAVTPGLVGALRADAPGVIRYAAGTSVTGGILRGGGQQIVEDARFTSATVAADAVVVSAGGGTFSNLRNAGRLTSAGGALTIDVGNNEPGGTLTIHDSTVNAGAFSSAGVIVLGDGGVLRQGGVNMTLGGGSRTTVAPGGRIAVDAPAALELSGALLVNHGTVGGVTNVRFNSVAIGSGTFGTVNVFDNAIFSPGASAGTTVFSPAVAYVAGDFSAADAATLRVQIGGATPGAGHDRVEVTGLATLGGILDISLAGGFTPLPGDYLAVFAAAGGVHGAFDVIVGQQVNPGTWLVPVYGPQEVLLTVALPGDATLDGTVDIEDFARLAANFNLAGLDWRGGDFTGDGAVGVADFSLLASKFNLSVLPPVRRPAAIPEPRLCAVLPLLLAVGRAGERVTRRSATA